MIKISGTSTDVQGRAVKITTHDNETGKDGTIVLSADFCHFCVDDLAAEFSAFMKEKGHDITQGKKIQ